MVILEFSRRYSMAHRLLSDASSKCVVPHGHDEVVKVRLRPTRPMDVGRSNMTAAFEHAKGRWHAWIDGTVDHALQLGDADPLIDFFRTTEPQHLPRLMVFKGDPTTEALVIAFWRKLSAFLAVEGLFTVDAIHLMETPTNSVSVTAADMADVDWSPGDWCLRADDSINDLTQ